MVPAIVTAGAAAAGGDGLTGIKVSVGSRVDVTVGGGLAVGIEGTLAVASVSQARIAATTRSVTADIHFGLKAISEFYYRNAGAKDLIESLIESKEVV